MFKIENLLSLFPDESTKEMLIYSYYLSQDKDKRLSDYVFEQLLLLKTMNPNINIVLDPTKEKSCFIPNENIIYLNSLSIETFFHELTHLLSYNYLNFQIPYEYYLFKRNFLANQDNTSLIMDFLDLCKRKESVLFQKVDSEDINLKTQNVINGRNGRDQEPQSNELNLICMIEDIIDSIYDGKSFTQGLVSVKDNNTNAHKAQKTSGHGCEYFSSNGFQFEEILANYQAIKLTDPNNELFSLLKNILGIEFVSFLDKRCNEICYLTSKIEINNNNISRK